MDYSQHEEEQYLTLIKTILREGIDEEGRNGITRSIFGYSMQFSLRDGIVPFLTTKQLAWKTCFKELIWFLSGSTDNKILQSQGVHIWDKNATPEFIQSRGIQAPYTDGLLGPVYGFQWRHFNADYDPTTGANLTAGVDQLQQVIKTLRNPATRNSRRIIMTAWNPCQLDDMALPPCHILAQFNVHSDKYLSCALYQRSGDVGLGVPFNIASYSLLTHLLAHHCGLEAHKFVYFLGNAHIYHEHIEALETQIQRPPFSFPKIRIVGNSKENIEDYRLSDLEFVEPYVYHPTIKMEMKA
jgi:thymidylate synthase